MSCPLNICDGSGILGDPQHGHASYCRCGIARERDRDERERRNRIQRVLDALNVTARHATEVSVEFLRGMAARMCMSYEKYGAVREAYPHKLDALASSEQRVKKYKETGNTEYLIDAANFLMIEFMCPRHRDAHFRATDSSESPGRINTLGQVVGAEANTTARENIRRGGARGTTSGGFYRHEGD